jgi:hypothetical protein
MPGIECVRSPKWFNLRKSPSFADGQPDIVISHGFLPKLDSFTIAKRKVASPTEKRDLLMKCQLAAIAFAVLAWCATAPAQDSSPKPRELDVLGQYVGQWTSEVVSKPAAWDENGTKFHAVSQAEMILGRWFLEYIDLKHVIVDPNQATKSLFLWTYDTEAKNYLLCVFRVSSG